VAVDVDATMSTIQGKPMRQILAACLLALFATTPSRGAFTVTFSTDQSRAQTQIDSQHTTAFDFAVLAGSPTITSIVGDFTIKRGSQTTSNITFTLFDRPNGFETPGAVALATVSLAPGSVSQQFNSTLFRLDGLSLGQGNYSVALTSQADTPQSQAYFIKGGNPTATPGTFISFNVQPVPEPGSLTLMGIAGAIGLGFARLRGRRANA